MLEIEREELGSDYGRQEWASARVGELAGPVPAMSENQIAALFRGRRYEDARNIPTSDRRPLPRHFW